MSKVGFQIGPKRNPQGVRLPKNGQTEETKNQYFLHSQLGHIPKKENGWVNLSQKLSVYIPASTLKWITFVITVPVFIP